MLANRREGRFLPHVVIRDANRRRSPKLMWRHRRDLLNDADVQNKEIETTNQTKQKCDRKNEDERHITDNL